MKKSIKRIPLVGENIKLVHALFTEYREKREQAYELGEDCRAITEQLIAIYKAHGIDKKEYNGKIYALYDQVKYLYNANALQALKNKSKKEVKEIIRMTDAPKG